MTSPDTRELVELAMAPIRARREEIEALTRRMTDEVALKYLADIRESEAALAALAARVEEAERDARMARFELGAMWGQVERAEAAKARVEELTEALRAMCARFVLERDTVENAVALAEAALRGGSPTPPPPSEETKQ